MKLETLFLVDDDETFQFIAQHTIQNTGVVKSIRIFSNGQVAIDFLESVLDKPELQPDVILLDLTMPVLDGWGFLEDFALMKPRLGKKIVIYVLSSSINPIDVERAKNISDVTDYVVKPITQEKFIALLNNM
jgi:CheY-like chemotaxis protein